MAEDAPTTRYVKLSKVQDAPAEEIRPGELNQPVRVPHPEVKRCSDCGQPLLESYAPPADEPWTTGIFGCFEDTESCKRSFPVFGCFEDTESCGRACSPRACSRSRLQPVACSRSRLQPSRLQPFRPSASLKPLHPNAPPRVLRQLEHL